MVQILNSFTHLIPDFIGREKKLVHRVIMLASLFSALGIICSHESQAQVFGPQEIKWLWVSPLRHWFSNGGAEIECGRFGRNNPNQKQNDGLCWPAQYKFQDHNVSKTLWIGTTNFIDPTNGVTYPYKVIDFGHYFMYINTEIYPEEFRLIGRFKHPIVTVDGAQASDLDSYDLDLTGGEDRIDPALPADRMIYNRVNTPIGITIYRKVLAFTQQYNDNYFIYEYVFKNTGFINNTGGKLTPPPTLTGVVFDFRYRFADCNMYYARQGLPASGVLWGWNTINDAVGQDAAHALPAPNNFRAIFEYYGPFRPYNHYPPIDFVSDDIGGPDYLNGSVMGGTHFMGEAVLHADTSPYDTTDDPVQPRTVQFTSSENTIDFNTTNGGILPWDPGNSTTQFDSIFMRKQYQNMTQGNSAQTHAQQVGEDANGWPTDVVYNKWEGGAEDGGVSSQQSYGPYTLVPGDSIRIVIAEAVAGINYECNREVTKNWWTWYNSGKRDSIDLKLPLGPPWNGGTTKNGNIYKNVWVFTGKDSLFQTFRRAIANYNSGYTISEPPPPPDKFTVTSGDDKVTLTWSNNADTWPNFNGYRLYRSEGKTDTTFTLIYSCNAADVVHSFIDTAVVAGLNYFYYIQSKDDGSTSPGSAALNIPAGEPLTSSIFFTMTNIPALPRRSPADIPTEFNLKQNYPNPFNLSTTIEYGIPPSTSSQNGEGVGFVNLKVYDILGREVAVLLNEAKPAGTYKQQWNAEKYSSGIYFYRLRYRSFSETKKLILLK